MKAQALLDARLDDVEAQLQAYVDLYCIPPHHATYAVAPEVTLDHQEALRLLRDMRRAVRFEEIEARLLAAANEAFDPEETLDSDGLDQAEREGIIQALEIIREVMS